VFAAAGCWLQFVRLPIPRVRIATMRGELDAAYFIEPDCGLVGGIEFPSTPANRIDPAGAVMIPVTLYTEASRLGEFKAGPRRPPSPLTIGAFYFTTMLQKLGYASSPGRTTPKG